MSDNEKKGGGIGGFFYTATGARTITRSVKSAFAPVGMTAGIWKTFFRMFKMPTHTPITEITQYSDDAERFRAAMEYYGRDEEDLAMIVKRERNYAIYFTMLLIAMASYGTYLFSKETGYLLQNLHPIFNIIFCYSLCLPLAAYVFKHTFHYSQMKNRRLYSVGYWLRKPVALTFGKVGTSIVPLIALAVVATMTMTPSSAVATTADVSFYESGLFEQVLAVMLSGIGPIPEAPFVPPTVSGLGTAFAAFSTGIMALATFLMGLQTILATTNAAYSAQPFSKQFHGLYGPLRVATGFASLAPVFNGFNVMQMLVLQVMLVSSDLADDVWSKYLEGFKDPIQAAHAEAMETQKVGYIAPTFKALRDKEMFDLAYGILDKQMCVRGIRETLRAAYHRSGGQELYGVPFEQLNNQNKLIKTSKSMQGVTTPLSDVRDAAFGGLGITDRDLMDNWDTIISGKAHPKITDIKTIGGKLGLADTNTKAYGSKYIVQFGEQSADGSYAAPTVRLRDTNYHLGIVGERMSIPYVIMDYGTICGQIVYRTDDITKIHEIMALYNTVNDKNIDDAKATHERVSSKYSSLKEDTAVKMMGSLVHTLQKSLLAMNNEIEKVADIVQRSGGSGLESESFWEKTYPDRAIERRAMSEAYSNIMLVERAGMITRDSPLAGKITATPIEVLGGAITQHSIRMQTEISTYHADMEKLLNENGFNNIDKLFAEAKGLGWAGAGTYYVILARLASTFTDTSGIEASFVDPEWKDLAKTDNQKNMAYWLLYNNYNNPDGFIGMFHQLDKLRIYIKNESASILPVELKIADDAKGISAIFSSLSAWAGNLIVSVYHAYEPDPYHALVDSADLGYKLLQIAELVVMFLFIAAGLEMALGAFSGLGVTKAASSVAGAVGKIGGSDGGVFTAMIASFITTAFFTIIIILYGVGIAHAYIIPMIPWLMWYLFLISTLILLIEAFIAAPLFALVHIDMGSQNDELINEKQKAGWKLILNLILRPSLGILGLILSFSLFAGGSFIMSKTLAPSFFGSIAVSGQSGGIIAALVYCIISLYLHYTLAIKSFGMISGLVDRINAWLGLAASGQNEEGEINNNIGMMTRNISSRTESVAQKSGAAAAGGLQQAKAKKDAEAMKRGMQD